MPFFLHIKFKLLSPLCPRCMEEEAFSFLLIVPGGSGNLLFVTSDHFLPVAAGHGRGVGSAPLRVRPGAPASFRQLAHH